jgi:hypothetical protein
MDEWDEAVDQRFWIGFMQTPLVSVLDDRKEPHLLPSDRKQPIIDEVIGEHDLCLCSLSFSVGGYSFDVRFAMSILQGVGVMGTK